MNKPEYVIKPVAGTVFDCATGGTSAAHQVVHEPSGERVPGTWTLDAARRIAECCNNPKPAVKGGGLG
jgi:hypothetical protein